MRHVNIRLISHNVGISIEESGQYDRNREGYGGSFPPAIRLITSGIARPEPVAPEWLIGPSELQVGSLPPEQVSPSVAIGEKGEP